MAVLHHVTLLHPPPHFAIQIIPQNTDHDKQRVSLSPIETATIPRASDLVKYLAISTGIPLHRKENSEHKSL